MTDSLKNISILLVEDDVSIVNMLQAFFVSKGATIKTVGDGAEALRDLTASSFDAIILDVVLPSLDGFKILERMRAAGVNTPVVMLTDQASVNNKIRGLNLGADDYITKPFSTRELAARVRAILRRNNAEVKNQGSQLICVGNITVNVSTREVLVGEKYVNITKTEFDLLYYLAQRKHEVVSHDSLLQDVLNYQSTIETKAVVMHLANLRKKLNHAGSSGVIIKPIPGVGYRLIDEKVAT